MDKRQLLAAINQRKTHPERQFFARQEFTGGEYGMEVWLMDGRFSGKLLKISGVLASDGLQLPDSGWHGFSAAEKEITSWLQ